MNRRLTAFVAIIGTILLSASITTVASSPKITLTIAPHKAMIPLQTYDIIITTPTRAFIWNFTVDLTGKDIGSDRFNLVVDASASTAAQIPLIVLFSDQNLTTWLSEPLTTHGAQELAYSAFVPASYNSALGAFSQTIASAETMTFLPLASGIYHVVVLNPNAFGNYVAGAQASIHLEIHGDEAWTTTTLG